MRHIDEKLRDARLDPQRFGDILSRGRQDLERLVERHSTGCRDQNLVAGLTGISDLQHDRRISPKCDTAVAMLWQVHQLFAGSPFDQSRQMTDQLRAAGVPVHLYPVVPSDHAWEGDATEPVMGVGLEQLYAILGGATVSDGETPVPNP